MINQDQFEALRSQLEAHQQAHVLRFWDQLSESQQAAFAAQLSELDFAELDSLIAGQDQAVDFASLAMQAQAPPAVKADGSGAAWSASEAWQRGEALLREGKVAVLIVAGGQGTRLGFEQPKGMFPIGPVSQRTLFQCFADHLLAVGQRYGKRVPLLLMTSPATHAETVAYMEQENYLGLDPAQVRIFCQGTMPAVDAETGKLLLSQPDSLALSPDGHGGTIKALAKSGSLEWLREQGIEQLFYAQVDNPLARLCDPALLGHHVMAGSEMTTQVVRKRFATERVGNVVLVDGRVQIIEYSDLPQEAAELTQPSGELKLWAGNIAVHVLTTDFVARVADSPELLPFHRAHKKVPHLDATGNLIEPDAPNATKFERFIFDLLPAAENAFVVEGLAAEVFAPVKNADGAETDTPAAAKEQICKLHASWLRAAGVEVAPKVQVEINPRLALDSCEVAMAVEAGKLPPAGSLITSDQYFA